MKTKNEMRNAECGVRNERTAPPAKSFRAPGSAPRAGFTLIELLVVIAIMAVLAGLTLVVVGSLKRHEYLSVASGEMSEIENALKNYHDKYGVYPPGNPNSPLENQLYYELVGTTNIYPSPPRIFQALDGSFKIDADTLNSAFGVSGLVNSSQYNGGEDGVIAQNFLLGLRANRVGNSETNGQWVSNLVTSVRGPDVNYKPLGVPDVNPFRYVYPGTNNPDAYDLWVQLSIGGKTYLVCNWSKQNPINSPLP